MSGNLDPSMKEVIHRLETLESGHNLLLQQNSRLQHAIQENTTTTNKVASDTADLVALFHNAKAGAGLIMLMVRIAKVVGMLAVSLTAVWVLYSAWKTGQVPSAFTKLPASRQ